jgi:spermidine/putrescine transport system permease protein
MPTRDPTRSDTFRAFGLMLPTWLVLGALYLLPMVILAAVSLHPPDDSGNAAPVANWGQHITSGQVAANYDKSVHEPYGRIQIRSFVLALVTTAACLLLGYPVAYYIALIATPARKNLLLALVVIPFWTCFLVRIAAWRLILQDDGLLNSVLIKMHLQGILNSVLINLHLITWPGQLLDTPLAVLIGLVYGELPYMILPLYASLEKLDRSLLEAAADLGAKPAARFLRVTLPLTLPGIVAGSVLVFIPGLGQFIVSDILGGSHSMMIGNIVQDQFTGGRNKPLGAAIALELTIAVLTMLIAWAWYARRRGWEIGL